MRCCLLLLLIVLVSEQVFLVHCFFVQRSTSKQPILAPCTTRGAILSSVSARAVLRLRGGQKDTPVAPGQSEQSAEPVTLTNDEILHQAIDEAVDAVGVLRVSARIPAVLANCDDALRITDAGIEDAELAVAALYRLAKVNRAVHSSQRMSLEDLEHDRRFEHLIEVVECQLHCLPLSSLSKIVWATSMLDYRYIAQIINKVSLQAMRHSSLYAYGFASHAACMYTLLDTGTTSCCKALRA
jgi:hypothetical protein